MTTQTRELELGAVTETLNPSRSTTGQSYPILLFPLFGRLPNEPRWASIFH